MLGYNINGRVEELAVGERRQLECPLEGVSIVDRLSMRDDHMLERELEQRSQRRQNSFFMPRGRPDA